MRPVLRVKSVEMMCAVLDVEVMKLVLMRIFAKMKFVVSVVGKTTPALIGRFALKRVARPVVATTKTAV